MTARRLLRIAAILSRLSCLGHSAGFPWSPSPGGQRDAIVQLMQSFHFDVFGSSRSYWDFYLGFGLTLSVFQLLGSVVLWLLAGLASDAPERSRSFVLAFFVASVAQLLLVLRFFFLPPIVLSLGLAVCLGLAAWVVGAPRGARATARS
ncbi:MAG TPA: hypothetical protein VFN91_13955 [Myxococcaceae bacterium]|nr:hypothetical protein [Myxococcaceae bacterium]